MELKTIGHGWALAVRNQTMAPEDWAWQAMLHFSKFDVALHFKSDEFQIKSREPRVQVWVSSQYELHNLLNKKWDPQRITVKLRKSQTFLVHHLLHSCRPNEWCFSIFIFIAPTSGPLNVQVSNTSSTSLWVTWVHPPSNKTHGVIRQYDIRYQRVDCNSSAAASSNWVHKTVDGSFLSTEITNLEKWSCYAIQIRAVTIKDGVWSDQVQQQTSEDGNIIYLYNIHCKSLKTYPQRFSWLMV